MGRDREARALAAGDTIEIVENPGKKNEKKNTYRLRPVSAQSLCDLERDALKDRKREYLSTFADNADLLGNGQGQALLEKEMRIAAAWDVEDLPQKDAFRVAGLPVTEKLKKWILEKYDMEPDSDTAARAILSTALDSGEIKPKEVKDLTGQFPLRGRVRYDQWWITASMNGMRAFILSSVRIEHPKMTSEDIGKWPFGKLAEAARIVEQLSVASMGNG